MTSKEHIESLRRHGVRLIGWDGATEEIPEDFLEKNVEFLNKNGARKITYSIKVPETEDELLLAIWDCGYAESGNAAEILSHNDR
jgi:hypothetical protein